ncbi:ribbon-helix-helix protein, CopG family [Rhizobium sp. CRIBSB]|nr:ribbon-helix-helix protein, CopG family [Rhizobium sp. CRIBSB]
MAARSSLTIELNQDIEAKLSKLAEATQRSRGEVANTALTLYVEREFRTIEAIRQGLVDLEKGDLVDHEDAMSELDAVIEAAEAARL